MAAGLLLLGFSAAVAHAESDRRTLVVGTRHAPPFAILNDDGSWSGISIDLWREIASDLDLPFKLREMGLDELLVGLETGELDTAVAALSMTAHREIAIDFSHPYFHSSLAIVVPREKTSSIIGRLSSVFNRGFFEAITALVTILIATGAAVWLFERRRNPTQFGGTPAVGLGAAFWWSAVTMTTVGYGDKVPVTAGGRIVALIWMFAAVVVTSGLTAAIASSLTVSRLESRFDELKDLTDEPVAVVRDSTSAGYLRDRGFRLGRFDTLEQGLAAVAAGKVAAMVHDEPILRYEFLTNPDQHAALDILPTTFEAQDYAIGLPPESPLREQINRSLLRRTYEDRWDQILLYYLGH